MWLYIFLETFYVQRNFPLLDTWTSSLIFEYPTLKVRRRPWILAVSLTDETKEMKLICMNDDWRSLLK